MVPHKGRGRRKGRVRGRGRRGRSRWRGRWRGKEGQMWGGAQLDPPLHPPGPVNLTHFTEKETETQRYLVIDQVNSGGVLCFPQGWVFRCRPDVCWTLAYYWIAEEYWRMLNQELERPKDPFEDYSLSVLSDVILNLSFLTCKIRESKNGSYSITHLKMLQRKKIDVAKEAKMMAVAGDWTQTSREHSQACVPVQSLCSLHSTTSNSSLWLLLALPYYLESNFIFNTRQRVWFRILLQVGRWGKSHFLPWRSQELQLPEINQSPTH